MWISIAESQRENTSNHNETEPGACCVWMSIAEDNTPNHNKTVPKKDPQDFPEIIYSFPTKVIFTSAVLFTFLMSVVGNSLVIYVITKYHFMRTSTNCLIMNLAICDLLLTVIQTPFNTSQLYYGPTWFGGTLREGLKTACLRCRPPEFRLFRIGQERQFETEEPMRNRQTSILTQEEGAIELTAYSTVNHRVAPLESGL
ncbi:Kappa-type opioid receptor [Desmophyllum pertusum]|uniref:Kappa-type opioid receptor n=1 Tax=Desmophyllum pertusum TaxID=174260 RepID=A0A9X0CWP0_9CNID|nr:Kappa-type opioid receptor [Desmophyllum pertusum]